MIENTSYRIPESAAVVARSLVCALLGLAFTSVAYAAAPSDTLPADPPNLPSVDQVLAKENDAKGVKLAPLSVVDDLAYLRRVSVDLIGRIPTDAEINEYLAWPQAERRSRVVDKLIAHERFTDKWTVFFADMLRLRSSAEGGAALIAYVHKAVEEGMPYDELTRKLISAGGKAGAVPEVGYILGDNADPMALAGVTSQVFMGIRISCAQCHDHPFDKWTQKDFYGFAAYFGKTRRQERRINMRVLGVYTTEQPQSTVLWPPEGAEGDAERKPMTPTFPLELAKADGPYRHMARLAALRKSQQKQDALAKNSDDEPSLDDLLAGAAKKAERRTKGGPSLDVEDEAKQDRQGIDLKAAMYRNSELRAKLAELVTDPSNHYFSRSFVNRVWHDLIGRGFVEPIDDFSDSNAPSHPQTLSFLADEFVAHGYDLKHLVRTIVTSQAYQRSRAYSVDEAQRQELEAAFLATPMRRMLSEVLYDSIITAGHLFEPKHAEGMNLKEVWQYSRVVKRDDKKKGDKAKVDLAAVEAKPNGDKMAMKNKPAKGDGYNLESAIELDFDSILKKEKEGVKIEKMMVKSAEEIEAERMEQEMKRQQADYVDVYVKRIVDDNPQYGTSMRMQSPAPDGHFLRVFGQPNRLDLGAERDQSPTMRQALMILNGKLTHEASRVGEHEPMHQHVAERTKSVEGAVDLAYREILTRKPTGEEVADAKEIIAAASTLKDGVADLRWVLLNCHEFRFLP